MITFTKYGKELDDERILSEISSDLSAIRQLIEENYGPITHSFLTNIDFSKDGVIVTEIDEGQKKIKITLPDYTLNLSDGASVFSRKLNLAHELVHTIIPDSKTENLTYLEEGLAVVLAEKYVKSDSSPTEKYLVAKKLVNQLLSFDSKIIATIRETKQGIKLSDISIADIIEVNTLPPLELLANLTKKFNE